MATAQRRSVPSRVQQEFRSASVRFDCILEVSALIRRMLDVDTKPCPKCGEEIKAVATRCRFCQADLSGGEPAPDFDRGVSPDGARRAERATPGATGDFEQRFLE